jgi:hypothetical protein
MAINAMTWPRTISAATARVAAYVRVKVSMEGSLIGRPGEPSCHGAVVLLPDERRAAPVRFIFNDQADLA